MTTDLFYERLARYLDPVTPREATPPTADILQFLTKGRDGVSFRERVRADLIKNKVIVD